MGKVRIYDLAKELKLESKKILEDARRMGVDVSVASNTLDDPIAAKIREMYYPKKKETVTVSRTARLIKHAPGEQAAAAAPAPVEAPAPEAALAPAAPAITQPVPAAAPQTTVKPLTPPAPKPQPQPQQSAPAPAPPIAAEQKPRVVPITPPPAPAPQVAAESAPPAQIEAPVPAEPVAAHPMPAEVEVEPVAPEEPAAPEVRAPEVVRPAPPATAPAPAVAPAPAAVRVQPRSADVKEATGTKVIKLAPRGPLPKPVGPKPPSVATASPVQRDARRGDAKPAPRDGKEKDKGVHILPSGAQQRTVYIPPKDQRPKGRNQQRKEKDKFQDGNTQRLMPRKQGANAAAPAARMAPVVLKPIRLVEGSTVREFAEKIEAKPRDIVTALMQRGVMATINQTITHEMATE
ncbi:MAG: translation initiation factor IF-2 N-terminal domain-containing protein, partial [Blastocatellia bacterium]